MTVQFTHSDSGVWSTDASDAGFAPGEWPEEIVAALGSDVRRAVLVNVHRDSGREITHVEYISPGRKLRLLVWND
jgi:hypothetical protein